MSIFDTPSAASATVTNKSTSAVGVTPGNVIHPNESITFSGQAFLDFKNSYNTPNSQLYKWDVVDNIIDINITTNPDQNLGGVASSPTVIKAVSTIGVVNTAADYNLVKGDDNSKTRNATIKSLVPANAFILTASIKCLTAPENIAIAIEVGTDFPNILFIDQADCSTENTVLKPNKGTKAPIVDVPDTEQNIRVSFTATKGKWSETTTGKWELSISYMLV